MLACAYGRDSPLTPALHMPSLLLDHARQREIAPQKLLRGTGLAERDFTAALALTPVQQFAMLANLQQAGGEADLAFVLGQQHLPGHYGAASLALWQAPSLGAALELLVARQAQLCPLLAPRLTVSGGQASLDWFDVCDAGALRPLLVDLHMSAVSAMSAWLGGKRLPWRYRFNRTRPRAVEQHQVHLGMELAFGAQTDSMQLDARFLDEPWPRGNSRAFALTCAELDAQSNSRARISLLQAVRERLFATITAPPTLEAVARHFAVSPATLKRQLARNGSHFQALLDEVRIHVSLDLIERQGFADEEVAAVLRFCDTRSFRRALARWMGFDVRRIGELRS